MAADGKYSYVGQSRCKCGVAQLWFTTPKGKRLSINQEKFIAFHGAIELRGLTFSEFDGKTQVLPFNHFADCPYAGNFRRSS